jgi:hypothetical protein
MGEDGAVMAATAHPTPRHPDRLVQALKGEADASRRETWVAPWAGGKSLSATIPAGGAVTVKHGLGATPKGWFATDVRGGTIAFTVSRTAWDNETITWHNAGAGQVLLVAWVW